MKYCYTTFLFFIGVVTNKKTLELLFFLIVFIGQIQITNAQNSDKRIFVYDWFDQITGVESSELHYGEVYVEKHRMKSAKTKFFISPEFKEGAVYFNNQAYYNLKLKYDVFGDDLILQVKNQLGGAPLLLRKSKIDSFEFEGVRFKNIPKWFTGDENTSGFYEIYRTTPHFSVFKKHRKRLLKNLGTTSAYHEFEDLAPTFALEYGGELFYITKIKDIESIFPQYKDGLKSAFGKSLRGSKLIDDASIDVLVNFLEEQLSRTSHDE
ncbi:hypothetical protein [Flagellimonas sp.]|uniref:hypothetical protein n=1 Tax=Flagellimonas sp. TaxID=2058762 RepID=UPI003B5CC70B